jgi:hypothetical protein
VFGSVVFDTVAPDPADVAGFAAYLDRYRDGLAVERAAVAALPDGTTASTPTPTEGAHP